MIPLNNYISNTTPTKYASISIGSLNCRSLVKTSSTSVISPFIKHLRLTKHDLFTFQETHASSPEIISSLNMKFQSTAHIWTKHCGIISLNASLHIEPLFTSIDERLIHCRVSHINHLFPPFELVTIYAPPQPTARREFYSTLLSLPLFTRYLDHTISDHPPLFITGDFNYNSSRIRPPSTSPQSPINHQRNWHSFINNYFTECTHPSLDHPQSTFRRGNSSSTIDYIYSCHSFAASLATSKIEYLNSQWTDHALLSSTFKFGSDRHGPGLWKGNPNLAKNTFFITAFNDSIAKFHTTHLPAYDPLMLEDYLERRAKDPHNTDPLPYIQGALPPYQLWENLKIEIKRLMKSFSRHLASWRHKQLDKLHRKRERLMHPSSIPTGQPIHPRLHIVEHQIGLLQNEIAQNELLKSSRHWRENGETSAGYLSRTVKQDRSQRFIAKLNHPIHSTQICDTPTTLADATTTFYKDLFTAEPIDPESLQTLINTIPSSQHLTQDDIDSLTSPIYNDELLFQFNKRSKQSSPGMDGIPYSILKLLFQHHLIAPLALQVYNDALINSIFPPSWHDSCMALLPKKGDLLSLSNYRPISLIDTDTKTFTRLINSRLMALFSSRISLSQMGFMPNRFIGEQGRLVHLAQLHAQTYNSNAIGLCLDQQKAYDRVHPEYMKQILIRFGIPNNILNIVSNLFFSSRVHININGHITDPFIASRGLRQGDPLSPLLFNIAFDPFLRLVSQDLSFQGFSFSLPPPLLSPSPIPPPI